MSFMRSTEARPPPIRADEYAECQWCKAQFSAYDLNRFCDADNWHADFERAVCPCCGTFEQFIKRRRVAVSFSWAERWGGSRASTPG